MKTAPRIPSATAALCALAAALLGAGALHADEPEVIELTQTGCQFLEPEKGVDHGFEPQSKSDCEAINERTAEQRLSEAKVMRLEPGRYVFRVHNDDVPYELGFWIRGDGVINRARLPGTSGGGLTEGATKDYAVELTPGEYVYSCPLNPTPDYKLVVEG